MLLTKLNSGTVPQQVATNPVPPPDPAPDVYGHMTWDVAPCVQYTPGETISATLEYWNPTSISRRYVIQYYFVNSEGVVAGSGYLLFLAFNGINVVDLPPVAEKAYTNVTFSAPSTGYRFGLRMIEVEEVSEGTFRIIREVAGLETVLADSCASGGIDLTSLMAIMMMGMVTMKITGG